MQPHHAEVLQLPRNARLPLPPCFIEALDVEEAAEGLYDDLDRPTPSAAIMQRRKDWLYPPDNPPSQAARLYPAKLIISSRWHRYRFYLARTGFQILKRAEDAG